MKYDQKTLFDFMLERVTETANEKGYKEPQAFGVWFANMYCPENKDIFVSDGTKDGKVDIFFKTIDGDAVFSHVINAKFTQAYNQLAPNKFYEEIIFFYHAFNDKRRRYSYLEKAVKHELRPYYQELYDRFDNGMAQLMFITNHRRNDAQYKLVKDLANLKIYHLEDIIQFIAEDLEGAMPITKPIILSGINILLSPDDVNPEVPNSIVFAKLIDFIGYMKKDPFNLLFARNVRVYLGNQGVNKEIRETFEKNPSEFVFSNNGITILCDDLKHDPPAKELTIYNPRVVNGAQTLHSIRDVPNPSSDARVMVRIIKVRPIVGADFVEKLHRRKEVINKIAERTNYQNPIKKSDLVSNDDFQHGLYLFFRKRNIFYERRRNEWNEQSRSLKSMIPQLKKGPSLPLLTQLIASYYWDKKNLGPAIAKSSKEALFGENSYNEVKKIGPELAYQIYLLGEIEDNSYPKTKRFKALKGHIKFALFSLMVKGLSAASFLWGRSEFTKLIEKQYNSEKMKKLWTKIITLCGNHIYKLYRKKEKVYRGKKGKDLTYNNYFKSSTFIDELMGLSVPSQAVNIIKKKLIK